MSCRKDRNGPALTVQHLDGLCTELGHPCKKNAAIIALTSDKATGDLVRSGEVVPGTA
jgi:hypothetical protein